MALAIHVLLLMAIISVGGLHADSYPFAHATAIVTPTIRLVFLGLVEKRCPMALAMRRIRRQGRGLIIRPEAGIS
ncbi:hypothetical protein GR212_27930 [Rhizobium lusitanum]|uniref:Uncharacterized protein n=1 Tax=Rhizobium lusitanum TaxID=293958 RepID=A0A6L9UFM9_9HYPH|nr:hypothetical protein [Rhizobium lusitanum]NEI73388.1 hypothetical protein [Rhizobium lusitanum]